VAADPGWGNFAGTNFTFAGGTLTSNSTMGTEFDLNNTSYTGSNWQIQSVGSDVAFHTGNLEVLHYGLGLILTPQGGGALSAGLSIGFGSSLSGIPATPGVLNVSTGYQINGNALATSNLADVTPATGYTPVLAFGGGSSGLTCASCTGTYSQVGKLVVASFNITLSAKGSSTGLATITLPVASSTTAPSSGICSYYGNMSSSVVGTITLASQGVTNANLTVPGSAGMMALLSDASFTNTSTLKCSLTYVSN
jgi:hypothetical protein